MIEKVIQNGVEYKVEKVEMKEGTKFIDLGPRGNVVVSVIGDMIKVTVPNSESNVGNLSVEQAVELVNGLMYAVERIRVRREASKILAEKNNFPSKEDLESMSRMFNEAAQELLKAVDSLRKEIKS